MVECPALPQPADGKQSTLMADHVEVARLYQHCRNDHKSLIDSVKTQAGIVINGSNAAPNR